MRTIYLYGYEVFNIRKIRVFVRDYHGLILASMFGTVLLARLLKII